MQKATKTLPAENDEARITAGVLIPRYPRRGGTPAEKITKAALIESPSTPHTTARGKIPKPLTI